MVAVLGNQDRHLVCNAVGFANALDLDCHAFTFQHDRAIGARGDLFDSERLAELGGFGHAIFISDRLCACQAAPSLVVVVVGSDDDSGAQRGIVQPERHRTAPLDLLPACGSLQPFFRGELERSRRHRLFGKAHATLARDRHDDIEVAQLALNTTSRLVG